MNRIQVELRRWAPTLDYWEQAALERVVAGVEFSDSDYEDLLRYLLEDAGLLERDGPRRPLKFPFQEESHPERTAPVRLLKISNLQNVNALVSGQTLTFGSQLTAVFGANGSGKSGYARVLGCAGFTRGDQEVLPDVTRGSGGAVVLSADMGVDDGDRQKTIHYKVGERCPELGSLYVFDSTSVRVHLTESNALSFAPAGLSYLTELARVTDDVRERLKARIREYSEPQDFTPLFYGESVVSTLIANLGPDTNLVCLHDLAQLSPEEEDRIKTLDKSIAILKATDSPKQIAYIEQTTDDLGNLAQRLRVARDTLSDEASKDVCAAAQVYVRRRLAAERVGVEQFKSEHFTQTGSGAWRQFVEAAKALAEAEGTPEKPYPQAESRCLLCQQPLGDGGRELLLRLWAFIEGQAKRGLEEAAEVLESKGQQLGALDLDFFNEQSVSHRYLGDHDRAVLEQVIPFTEACRRRRHSLRQAVAHRAPEVVCDPLPESGISGIEQVISSLKVQLEELRRKDPSEEIARLEQDLHALRHREMLGRNLPQIDEYVKRLAWAHKASKAGGNTGPITRKYNQLFKKLVTARYVQLFAQTLKDLGREVKVDVKTSGKKGRAFKQIVLRTSSRAPEGWRAPDKVLSEGEKRAVALADFLTEVALDTTSSAIVLDDPVTSLDLEWRKLIASILAKEARRRQVIVFTHDLPFLYFLKKYAEEQDADIASHWIKRGDIDDKPGYVFVDNSPAVERDYRKATRARDIYAKAKSAPAEEQEALLREAFGALRTCYEAFIIFELFNEVVMRFEERISFGRLKDIVWDNSVADEVIRKCELLSRYIEGHLHSDAFAAEKPTAATLLSEIEAFDVLRKRHRDLKNPA
ncbi:MAG: AAA family ATPase [Anaerolineae bacterium]|nr:AAA family ATPase [Anaerolineae bacterium]